MVTLYGDAAAITELQALANACHRGAARRLIRLLARRMRQGDKTAAAELRALAEADDWDAAGRLGEELAEQGDPEGALQVWARIHGDYSPTTKRLAELHAEESDLDKAVSVWRSSDAVHQNPAGTHQEYLDTMDDTTRMEMDDEPEDWAFIESEKLAWLLAERAERVMRRRGRSCGLGPMAGPGDPQASNWPGYWLSAVMSPHSDVDPGWRHWVVTFARLMATLRRILLRITICS